MKVDILAFAAHPDDVELACSASLMKMHANGKTFGLCDLTRGELGTRGSAELRAIEAAKAAEIMQASFRVNLDLGDGFFEINRENQIKIIEVIRRYKPEIVLCNAVEDRHIDHGRASKLVSEACFLSGLRKIETFDENEKIQQAHRPKALYHYIQDQYIKPDFIIDVSAFAEKKIEAIMAFSSQFFDPSSKEPETPISSRAFFEFVKARMREMGRPCGYEFGEGFTVERPIGVNGFFDVF